MRSEVFSGLKAIVTALEAETGPKYTQPGSKRHSPHQTMLYSWFCLNLGSNVLNITSPLSYKYISTMSMENKYNTYKNIFVRVQHVPYCVIRLFPAVYLSIYPYSNYSTEQCNLQYRTVQNNVVGKLRIDCCRRANGLTGALSLRDRGNPQNNTRWRQCSGNITHFQVIQRTTLILPNEFRIEYSIYIYYSFISNVTSKWTKLHLSFHSLIFFYLFCP